MSDHEDEVDCGDVLEAVYLYLDGEIDAESLHKIRHHLDDCSPCLREFGIEREVKILVARSCHETAPDDLRQAVLARINVVRSELTQVGYTEVRYTEVEYTEVEYTETRENPGE